MVSFETFPVVSFETLSSARADAWRENSNSAAQARARLLNLMARLTFSALAGLALVGVGLSFVAALHVRVGSGRGEGGVVVEVVEDFERVDDLHRLDLVVEFELTQIGDFVVGAEGDGLVLEFAAAVGHDEGVGADAEAADVVAPAFAREVERAVLGRALDAHRLAAEVRLAPDIYVAVTGFLRHLNFSRRRNRTPP